MLNLSVIICTHNPSQDYFKQCLSALKCQSLCQECWELIVIDNCSETPLENYLDISWHRNGKINREEKLGLTPARLHGIREAKGNLLIFVDDDNVLDVDYLETALNISKEKSFLGAWSGQCIGVFEELPPEWTKRYWGNLVLREFEEDVWSNLPRLAETMPCGAGLCIRREVAQYYLGLYENGKRTFQFDRSGDSLISGGDNDLAACACSLGLGVGLVSSLKLKHLIKAERFTPYYLARLSEGIMFSGVILAYLWNDLDELSSYKVKFHHVLRALALPYPHRRIRLSALRGQRKGFSFIDKKMLDYDK